MSTHELTAETAEPDAFTMARPNGFWRRARHSPAFIAGAIITALLVLIAICAPWISPYSPDHQDLYNILSGFSSKHLLGTDQLGRDELSRLLWASRTDLQVGVIAVIFPFCFGTLMGTLTGYFGGWFDAVVMRVVDVVIAFPFYVFVIGLVFNEKLPQFADRHVRRAITYAINRPALVAATSFGTAKPGGSFVPPSLEYYDPNTPVLAYSLANAKAELAKSKYPHGFDTKLLISGGVQKWSEFAAIIQQSLAPLNIKVTIDSPDNAAFHTQFESFNYDMFIDYAINDISDPDEMASFELDFKDGGSSSYWSSYNNPKVIALVHQAEAEFNATKRASLYAQIQSLVAEDAPFVPLDYPPYIYATSKSVQGFAVNPGGAYRLEDVWLT
jgi:hypothetical protein